MDNCFYNRGNFAIPAHDSRLSKPEYAHTYCGIDEAGRGPLAGPVVAAAVILPSNYLALGFDELADSKTLKEHQRLKLCALIQAHAAYSVGCATPQEIDSFNILGATMVAMKRAWRALLVSHKPQMLASVHAVLVDGPWAPTIAMPCSPVIRGDSIVPAIMAASIVAKVLRDSIMHSYSAIYSQYEYSQHKGYPTLAHRRMIQELGPSPIQRMSFALKNVSPDYN